MAVMKVEKEAQAFVDLSCIYCDGAAIDGHDGARLYTDATAKNSRMRAPTP